jgi:hypothetical protein
MSLPTPSSPEIRRELKERLNEDKGTRIKELMRFEDLLLQTIWKKWRVVNLFVPLWRGCRIATWVDKTNG